jgi:hypothetical protein
MQTILKPGTPFSRPEYEKKTPQKIHIIIHDIDRRRDTWWRRLL